MSGNIVITNDGNAILREIDVVHPAAKSMIDLSRSQDEEVGDGTTSVIILSGEVLSMAEPLLERNIHPREIISGFTKALEDSLEYMRSIAHPLDLKNREQVLQVVKNCLATKIVSSYFPPKMSELALDAVESIAIDDDGRREVDIKRFIKIEKIPGGDMDDCEVIPGIVLNKDVTHAKMRRHIENPRIVCLDCSFEYKKGDNQTNIDITKPEHWEQILKKEEEYVKNLVDQVAKFKPDIVVTEKGISDLAQHYFVKYGITALRRLKKTDSDRLSRASGATVVHRPSELRDSDVGTRAKLFEVRKIGDEYFSYIICENAKACTIVLRGGGKDLLNEIERNLHDALFVARNVVLEPLLLPGGGATEMAVATMLMEKSKSIPGIEQYAYNSVAIAMEVIPRTLIQNCGSNVIKTLTQLRAKHASGEGTTWGVDGEKGVVRDMKEMNLLESYSVKIQTMKTAIEAACMLLRVDEVLSGLTKKESSAPSGPPPQQQQPMMMPDMDGMM